MSGSPVRSASTQAISYPLTIIKSAATLFPLEISIKSPTTKSLASIEIASLDPLKTGTICFSERLTRSASLFSDK